MAFTVVYDACVLYPAALRDLLIRVALTGLVRAKWTDEILDECFAAIREQRPNVDAHALARTRRLMISAVPDCLVTGYDKLTEGLSLPDENDHHVLAAAIRSGAQSIVTFNLKDFPSQALDPFGIEAVDPDDYVVGLVDLAPGRIAQVVQEQSADLKRPPVTVEELLHTLEQQGLPQSAAKLRGLPS